MSAPERNLLVALTRLRKVTVDPLLVRAGRALAPCSATASSAASPQITALPVARSSLQAFPHTGRSTSRGTASSWAFLANIRRGSAQAREIATIVDNSAVGLTPFRETDLIATVLARQACAHREGMQSLALPFDMPKVAVALIWHPRQAADAAHRWLCAALRDTCSFPASAGPGP